MSFILRAGAVSLLAVALAACGGGGGGNADEDAIEEMVQQLFQAFEDGDAAALAALFSEQCGDMTAASEAAIQQFETFDAEVDLDGVDIVNLTESSAEFLPLGTLKSGDQETELSSPDEEHTPAVKENGVWKIAECELFL